MATISSLAVKIKADVSGMTKDISDVIKSVEKMSSAVKTTRPNIENLSSAADGYGQVLKAVENAQANIGGSTFNGNLDDQRTALENTQKAALKVRLALQDMGSGIANKILDMEPSIGSIKRAQRELEKLKQIRDGMGENGSVLDDSITQAERNMGQLANNAAQAQIAMSKMQSVLYGINAVPFIVIGNVFSDLLAGLKTFASDWNKYFGGVPGVIAQVAALLASVAVVIGICNTQAALLGITTMRWNEIMKESLVVQGFISFWAMLDGTRAKILLIAAAQGIAAVSTGIWAAAQWALNTAMYANPIGAVAAIIIGIAAAVAALIYGITLLVQWWYSDAEAVNENANRIKNMEAAMKDVRDRIGEAADKYKELNNAAKQYHDANQSGAQKYLAELQKIDEAMSRGSVADSAMGAINQKNNELVRALEKAKAENKKDSNADLIKSIEQQIKDLEGDRVNLAEEMRNSPAMSADDAAAAKKDAYQKMLESLGVVKTDAEKFAEMSKQLEAAKKHLSEADYKRAAEAVSKLDPAVKERLEAEKKATDELKRQTQERKQLAEKFIDMGKTEQDKYNEMLAQLESVKNMMPAEQYAKSLSALQQQNPIIKQQNEELKKQIDEQKKLAEKEKQAREQLLDKFRQMANDSPAAKFNELKKQLDSVRSALSPDDFRNAADKLDSDLAGGLGIAEFLKPEQSPAEKLADVYKKLEGYADKINDPFFDLAAAKQRAADKLSKDDKKKDKPEPQVKMLLLNGAVPLISQWLITLIIRSCRNRNGRRKSSSKSPITQSSKAKNWK